MNGLIRGERASKLISELTKMVALHGDLEVYVGGGDYPEGFQRGGVRYVPKEKGDGYVPGNSFKIG